MIVPAVDFQNPKLEKRKKKNKKLRPSRRDKHLAVSVGRLKNIYTGVRTDWLLPGAGTLRRFQTLSHCASVPGKYFRDTEVPGPATCSRRGLVCHGFQQPRRCCCRAVSEQRIAVITARRV